MGNQWHYNSGAGGQAGPVSAHELKRLAHSGQLSPDDLVWKEGMGSWVAASKVKGLFDNLAGGKSAASVRAAQVPGPTGPPQLPAAVRCPGCGAVIPNVSRYCMFCGRALLSSSPTTKKTSPNEMVSDLINDGLTVSKDTSINSSLTGAEIGFWIFIGNRKVAAYRFDSPEKAREKAEAFENGAAMGYWAFEFVPKEYAKLISRLSG